MWWHMSLIPAFKRQRQEEEQIWVQGQPGLHCEFQTSQSYTVRPYLNKTPKTTKNKTPQNKTTKKPFFFQSPHWHPRLFLASTVMSSMQELESSDWLYYPRQADKWGGGVAFWASRLSPVVFVRCSGIILVSWLPREHKTELGRPALSLSDTTNGRGWGWILYPSRAVWLKDLVVTAVFYLWVVTPVGVEQPLRRGCLRPLENTGIGAGEMAQWLRVLTALPEVMSSIPSIHMVAYNHPRWGLTPSSGVPEDSYSVFISINKSF